MTDRKKLIEKKIKELKILNDKIYAMDGDVSRKVKQLKEKNEHDKGLRVKKIRDDTHHKTKLQDGQHRSSDRDFGVRLYSKADVDAWTYPQVRDWYNTYAPSENPLEYRLRPVDTGYTIKVDDSYREPDAKILNDEAFATKHAQFMKNYRR